MSAAFQLTERERLVLEFRRAGLSYKEIAVKLGVKWLNSLIGSHTRAVDKERLMLLKDIKPKRRSTLAGARGTNFKGRPF